LLPYYRALSGIADPEGFMRDVIASLGLAPLQLADEIDARARLRAALLARKAGR
jgi:hypothetical protein